MNLRKLSIKEKIANLLFAIALGIIIPLGLIIYTLAIVITAKNLMNIFIIISLDILYGYCFYWWSECPLNGNSFQIDFYKAVMERKMTDKQILAMVSWTFDFANIFDYDTLKEFHTTLQLKNDEKKDDNLL